MGRDRDEITISINWKSFKLGEGYIKLFDFYVFEVFNKFKRKHLYGLAKELIMLTPKLHFKISVEKFMWPC